MVAGRILHPTHFHIRQAVARVKAVTPVTTTMVSFSAFRFVAPVPSGDPCARSWPSCHPIRTLFAADTLPHRSPSMGEIPSISSTFHSAEVPQKELQPAPASRPRPHPEALGCGCASAARSKHHLEQGLHIRRCPHRPAIDDRFLHRESIPGQAAPASGMLRRRASTTHRVGPRNGRSGRWPISPDPPTPPSCPRSARW